MPVFSYRTIQAAAEGSYKEKGSKFLAFAYPVSNEEEVKERLAALRKEFFDARHHCYGWILGPEKSRFRANDDGEPNHSAGDPILGQIRSKDLTDVLVVVVRYFGGVKLGVGGLISAYKIAAEDALNHAVIVECDVKRTVTFRYSYASTPEVMRLVKDFELEIIGQQFLDDCKMEVSVTLQHLPGLIEKADLLRVTGTDLKMEEL